MSHLKRPKYSDLCLIILLIAMSFVIWHVFFSYHVTTYGDGIDYAQIARNIYDGHGMTTNTLPLCGLEFMKEHDLLDNPWPNLHRFPLPVYMITIMYYLFGINDYALAFASGLFYILSVPVFYILSYSILSSRKTAFLVTLIFALNPMIIRESFSAGTHLASIFFFILLIYVLYNYSSAKSYLIAGALVGISYYNRYDAILFIPVLCMLIWIFQEHERPKKLFFLVASFLVITTPWYIYILLYSNSPFFSLTSKAVFPVLTDQYPFRHSLWFGIDYVNEVDFFLAYPIQMISKWVMQFKETIKFFPTLAGAGNIYLFAFFFVGLFFRDKIQISTLKITIMALFFAKAIVLCFYLTHIRYYFGFIPIFILLSFYYLNTVVRKLDIDNWKKWAVISLFVLFSCSFGVKRMIFGVNNVGVTDYGFGSEIQKSLSHLNQSIGRDDTVCSDIVVVTGRYMDSNSIPLPKN